jgi:hypothetical protein
MKRAPLAIALAAFLTFALTGGGRIVGSDELTMLELARAMAHGRLAVPEGATLVGRDGRHYTKNTAGQAVLALPFVVAGDAAARAAGFRDARAEWAARFVASFFNAVVTALLLAALYAALRAFRAGARAAFAATVLAGFTTPLWVYAKSFMAEPLEALGLLLALAGAARAGAAPAPADARRSEGVAALGAALAVSAKLSVLPLALTCLAAAGFRRPRAWRLPSVGLALALGGHALYNLARFGTPFETGYGAQASLSAFTTPLLVGVYGLLLSSGKGVAWYAPFVWLVPAGLAAMVRPRSHSSAPRAPGAPATGGSGSGDDVRRAGGAVVATWAVGLFLYGRFQHWGGDGSWGPRYLVPLLPLAAIPVAFALESASKARKRLAWALGLLGLVVTLGGVGIYFGAQMREAGDYPYTRALDDPHFMEASHWNPRFTPIADHWRMLVRNTREHAAGEAPLLGVGGTVDPRTGLTPYEQQTLLHAIDVWWLYAGYAGLPKLPLALAAVALALAAWWAWLQAWRAVREDTV